MHRSFDVAEHDRDVRPQADAVRDPVRLEPLLRVDLVRADDRADLVVEDLGRGTRQRRQTGGLGQGEVLTEIHPESTGAFGDLERGEPMDVDVRATASPPGRLQVKSPSKSG